MKHCVPTNEKQGKPPLLGALVAVALVVVVVVVIVIAVAVAVGEPKDT